MTTNIPPTTKYKLDVGDMVRFYREKSRKWEGPFQITRFNKRIVWMTDGNPTKSFSITDVIHEGIKGRDDNMNRLIQSHTILEATHSYLTQILETRDPRWGSNNNIEDMKQDIKGLNGKDCFSVVNQSSLAPSANLLGGIFVIEVKNAA